MLRLVSFGLMAVVLVASALATPIVPEPEEQLAGTEGPSKTDVCHGKTDGTLIPDSSDHAKFFECNHNLAFPFHCPPTTVFSDAAHGCIVDPNSPLPQVPCTGLSHFDCKGKPDGMYPDASDKTRFHKCDAHCGSDFQCPPYTYFDTSRNVCAYDNSGPGPVTSGPVTQPPQTPAPWTQPHVTQPPVTQPPVHHEETTPTHWTPPAWTPAPHVTDASHTNAPHTDAPATLPPHHEETTVTPHFVTPVGPNEQTTRGRHN